MIETCMHDFRTLEMHCTTTGYTDKNWLICARCGGIIKRPEAGSMASVVFASAPAQQREAVGPNGLTHSQQQARISELEGMIERFWGTDAVKRAERAEAERDRLAATAGRLAGFIGSCRGCCEVYEGRCRKGREVPGLAALGGK